MSASLAADDASVGRATWMAAAAALLAIAFQLQATPDILGTPVRLSVADLLLPLLVAGLAVLALRGEVSLPHWRLPRLWLWLLALSAVLTVALLIGRLRFEAWLGWALVGKYAGWYVLLAYLVLGGMLTAYAREPGRSAFLRALLVFFWLTTVIASVGHAMNNLDVDVPEYRKYGRFEGFMDNPNAFGFLAAVCLVLQLPQMKAGELFSRRVHVIGLALGLVALIMAGSRSAVLGFALALPVLLHWKSVDWRGFVPALCLAVPVLVVLLYVVPYIISQNPLEFEGKRGAYLINRALIAEDESSLQEHIASAISAVSMWLHHPLLGAGLGARMWEQLEIQVWQPVRTHNTVLWLLSETGLLGTAAFAGFFFVCLRTVWRQAGEAGRYPFEVGLVATMIVYVGASVGMEPTYQRHLWFLFGAGLAVPAGLALRRVDFMQERAAAPRVLHVITGLGVGGAEKVLSDLVIADSKAGRHAAIVSLIPGGAQHDKLRAAGIAVRDLGMRRDRLNPLALLRLAAFIREHRPDVIQTWMYHADLLGLLALLLSGRRGCCRLYWGIRCSNMDLARYAPRLRLVIRLCAWLSRLPDGVIANSRAGRDWHRRLGYRPRQFAVIENGLDVDGFRGEHGQRGKVRAELGIDEGAFVIGTVARVDAMKNYPCLLAALERLNGTTCVAVGRRTEGLHAAPGLIRLGERQDVPRLLAAFDLLVSASAFGEGFSNAIAEGMAAGLPVVATDVGDARRIVGDAGVIVPAGDPGALASAIRSLQRDPSRRRELGERARRRIAAEFPLSRTVAAFEAFYRDPAAFAAAGEVAAPSLAADAKRA